MALPPRYPWRPPRHRRRAALPLDLRDDARLPSQDDPELPLQDRLACLLGQHGQISLGRTLESALALGIEVETISRLYVQALTLGEPPVLPDEEMARVLQQMKQMSYGQAPDLEGVNDVAREKSA